jgi:choline monooxygenase
MTRTAEHPPEFPTDAYVSEASWHLEQTALFARTWVHAASGFQLPDRGDVLPVTVAGQPLVLIRQRDGSIGAFHNVCRHRGPRLVREPCNVKAVLTCPYHGWAYGLDGALRTTPYWSGEDGTAPEGFDKADYGLMPVRSALWCDQIFVCLDEAAPSFEEHAAPLMERWVHADLSLLRYAAHATYDVPVNWKLVIENYLDTYHLPFLHPELGPVETARRFKTLDDGNLIGIHYTSGAADKNKGDSGFQTFPGFNAEQRVSQDIAMLFPNTLFEFVPEHVMFFRVEPLGPQRTRETLAFYFLGEDASDPALCAGRQASLDAWDRINRQDFTVLDELQAASTSPAARGLPPPSPIWELATIAFRKRALTYLERS